MLADLEAFWESVLSSDEARIRDALEALPEDERRRVLAHLRRMASDPGWAEAQRRNAAIALRVMKGT